MITNNLCIATISWARNEAEETLLRKSLEHLASFQLPVYLTDGGSTDSFLRFLQAIPHFTVLQPNGKGVFAQARTSLLAAGETGKKFILYTEPDKEAFFRTKLQTLLHTINDHDGLGVYLASRSAKAFATFPPFQQMTETAINQCCKEVIEKEVDYTYGPFVLNSKLVPYVNQVTEDIGWGWRPYFFTLARRLGLEVDSFAGDFACPHDQREDDPKERLYRMRQLEQNIRGIVLGATTAI